MDISLKMLNKIGVPFKGWNAVKEIGSGTYGSVFRIESHAGDVCALKVIPIPTSDADLFDAVAACGNDKLKARSMFDNQLNTVLDREISTAKSCSDCPNVFRVYEEAVVNDPNNPALRYIMVRMELLSDLKSYLDRTSATQKDVLKMMRDVASALCYLEKKRILHRDIKTANIMVDGNGVFKLTDFGEARAQQINGNHTRYRGTPYYMAPEVQKGRYDNRADIYSLGIVAYFFLNGRKYPFVGGSVRANDGYERRMRGEPCPPIRGADRDINRVVLKCIAYDMNNRYASAADLLHDINDLLKNNSYGRQPLAGVSAGRSETTSRSDDMYRSGKSGSGLSTTAIVLIVLGSVMLLALIIVLVVLLGKSGGGGGGSGKGGGLWQHLDEMRTSFSGIRDMIGM